MQATGASTTHRPANYIYDNPAAAPDGSENPVATASDPVRSMVQIMTLSNSEDAEFMVAALKRHGYNAAVNHDPLDPLLHLEVATLRK